MLYIFYMKQLNRIFVKTLQGTYRMLGQTFSKKNMLSQIYCDTSSLKCYSGCSVIVSTMAGL